MAGLSDKQRLEMYLDAQRTANTIERYAMSGNFTQAEVAAEHLFGLVKDLHDGERLRNFSRMPSDRVTLSADVTAASAILALCRHPTADKWRIHGLAVAIEQHCKEQLRRE